MSKAKKNFGFTLIELLVVLAIISILVGISTAVLVMLRQGSRLDVEAQRVVSALRLAQSRTVASESFNTHGVYFDAPAGTLTVFEGLTFNPLDGSNKTTKLDSQIQFSAVQIMGGGDEVVFSRIGGFTQNSGFVEIQFIDLSSSKIICIGEEGAVRALAEGQSAAECEDVALEYTDGDTAGDLAFFPSNSGFGDAAQSFTTDGAITVKQVDLLLNRQGTPSDIFLELRGDSTTGTVLGASNIVSGVGLPTTPAWVGFSFSQPVFLDALTQYFLRLRSLPDSTVPFSGGQGTVIWSYTHDINVPPAYGGGDAWRYVGRNDNRSDQGQQLGPADQYDFGFRLKEASAPPNTDSRHLEFDLGFSLRSINTITLSFNGGSAVTNIDVSAFMNPGGTMFKWEGDTDVGGAPQTIRIATSYIDDNDTILSIARDARLNNTALAISADGTTVVSYTAAGIAAKGGSIDRMTAK